MSCVKSHVLLIPRAFHISIGTPSYTTWLMLFRTMAVPRKGMRRKRRRKQQLWARGALCLCSLGPRKPRCFWNLQADLWSVFNTTERVITDN